MGEYSKPYAEAPLPTSLPCKASPPASLSPNKEYR